MPFDSLNSFIKELEKQGELVRVKQYISPELEITEITDRISKQAGGGKAILFENTGTSFPVLINMLGSENRILLALNAENYDKPGEEIDQLLKELAGPKSGFTDKLKVLPLLNKISSWMPKVVRGKGACQELVIKEADLDLLPVLKCWPHDGGKFITFPMVITKDPESGIRNVGMYRMQVFDKKTTGMHWHRHKTGARHYEQYRKLGKRMPISVALGGDPVFTYSATAPLPDNIDEFMLAGFLRKKKVELVKCITNEIEVPAEADIVIEGFVDTSESLAWEGPFGDHTGFYSLADWFPKFHVTCITHRKNAVFPATIVGIPPMEDAYIGKATERIFLSPIKLTMLPEIIDLDLPVAGVAHNIAIVKFHKTYPGQALKVMNSLWGAGQMMFNKILIAVSGDVDIHNYSDVAKAVSNNVTPSEDIHFSKGPLDILDHASSVCAFGGKIFFDASEKFPEELVGRNESLKVDTKRKLEINELPGFVTDINYSLIDKGISCIVISVSKSDSKVFDLIEMLPSEILCYSKFVVLTDANVDISDNFIVGWIASGNIDAQRDCKVVKHKNGNSVLIVDATVKTNAADSFMRDWPNPVVSSSETIEKIDNIWKSLKIGEFLLSPSVKYKSLGTENGAVR